MRAAEHAAKRGAAVVALIPVRGGNGEMERLASDGEFTPPALVDVERALDGCLGLAPTVVTADLWDIDRIAECGVCRAERVARLARLNESGRREPRIGCSVCGAA